MAVDERMALILLYHGVTDALSRGIENFSGKHITAEAFDRQMAYLHANASVFSLRDLATLVEAGAEIPPNAVAVTFDDGYRNNYDFALSILKSHGIPATFFLSTGLIGTDRQFWTDKVEHWINLTCRVSLDLVLDGEPFQCDLRETDQRIEAVIRIKSKLKSISPSERDDALSELNRYCEVDDDGKDVSNYQSMSWDQVRDLDSSPDYEVGGHTVNHEIMAYLDDAALEREIYDCIATVETELGHECDLFSYPEGQAEHYDGRTIAHLREAGVSICPSAIDGTNGPGTDPFQLRRVMVGFMGEPFPMAVSVA
ncbi:MAG: polysaccharide deacetylase family protein [Planctomycetes bacterium]|nr:polysaccharide deacetylase family protein [Planctomycetota bacterium]